jgi:hypothetical protein
MPRRHLRTYRRPKSIEPNDSGPTGKRPLIDYRPLVAVIGLVIFGLAAIAFLLTLRSK